MSYLNTSRRELNGSAAMGNGFPPWNGNITGLESYFSFQSEGQLEMLNPPTERCIGLDPLDCLIILEVSKSPNGCPTRRLAEVTGLSRSAAGSRVKKKITEEKKILVRKEMPHPNPKMPATDLYFLPTGSLTLQEFQYLTWMAKKAVKQAKSQEVEIINLAAIGDRSLTTSPTLLEKAIAKIPTAHRATYIQLLGIIAKEPITIGGISQINGRLRQTNSSPVKKLMDLGLIQREKQKTEQSSEYFYFLSPEVAKDEVLKLVSSEIEQSNTDFPKEQSDMDEKVGLSEVLPNSRTLAEKLLDKLPAFNPSWDSERQKQWFAAYQRLLEISERDTK